MNGNKPILIIGPPRSGTTWMWGLLESHPDTVAFTVHNMDGSTKAVKAENLTTTETGIFNKLEGSRAAAFIQNMQEAHPEKRLIEKSPTHTLVIPKIRQHINPQFVVMRRDLRAIVASYLNTQMKRFEGYTVQRAVKEIRGYVDAIKNHASGFDDCITVDYEALINDPKNQLRQLLQALEMDTKPIPQMIAANRGKVRANIPGAFRRADPEAWKTELTADQVKYINENT